MSTPTPILQYTLSDATMKGLLPAGYTPLAYIESTTSNQYIDTGFKYSSGNITIDCEYTVPSNNTATIFGSSNDNTKWLCLIYRSNSNSSHYCGTIDGSWANKELSGNKRKITYSISGTTCTLNDGKLSVSSSCGTIPAQTHSYTLWCHHCNNTFTQYAQNARIYYFRLIYQGNLTLDYRPARRDSDGVIGMYDLVSRTFKTNSGSGSFIAGPPLAVGKGGGKSLPEEYLLVEYLESTGTLYINTGLVVTSSNGNSYDFEASIIPTALPSSAYYCIAGVDANTQVAVGTDGKACVGNATSSSVFFSVGTQAKVSIKFASTAQTYYVNGTSTGLSRAINSETNIYLFSSLTNNYFFRGKIQYAKFGTARFFIPCYRKSDMKPGMYDVVNGVFYTNAGSGEFILGPSVNAVYTWEPNAGGYWIDNAEYSIAVSTGNPLPMIKVIPGQTYVLEYDAKAASNYTPTLGAILLEWYTSTSASRTGCGWTGVNIPLTTSYKRIHYEWTCPSGQYYVDFGRRASENVAHTIKNIVWKLKGNQGLYTNVSGIYDSSKGWVADFNGSSSDIQSISNLSQLLSGNTYTISAWVLARSTGNYRGIAGPHSNNTHGFIFGQCSGSSNGIGFNGISTTITLNTWIHFVLVNNNGSNSLYKNGELVNSNPVSFSTTMLNNPIIVGRAFYANDRYWDGEITNFLIFNVALTEAQVKELYGK